MYVCACTYVCMYVCMYVCVCMYVHVCTYQCMYVCMYYVVTYVTQWWKPLNTSPWISPRLVEFHDILGFTNSVETAGRPSYCIPDIHQYSLSLLLLYPHSASSAASVILAFSIQHLSVCFSMYSNVIFSCMICSVSLTFGSRMFSYRSAYFLLMNFLLCVSLLGTYC